MAHPFRTKAAASVAEIFARGGEPATYQPSAGAPVATRAYRDAEDVVAQFVPARIRQTGRVVALRTEDVPARPAKFDRITLASAGGPLQFTVFEAARSQDPLGLLWLCAVQDGFILAPLTLNLSAVRPRAFLAGELAIGDQRFLDLAFTRPKPIVSAAAVASLSTNAGVTRRRALLSAAFAARVSGSLVLTRPKALLSAAAVVSIAPVAAFTRPRAILSASASIPLAVALSVTRPRAQLAAFASLGAVRVIDMAISRPKPQLSALAAARLAAALSVTRPRAQLAAFASLGAVRVIDVAILRPKPQLSASASARLDVAAGVTRPKAQLTAAVTVGVVQRVIQAAFTRPKALISATAAAALAAAATKSRPKALLSSTATAALALAAGITRPKALLSAAASAALAAAAGVTRPKASLSAAADVDTPATGIEFVGGKTGSFVGSTTVGATVDLTSGLTGGIGSGVAAGDLVIVGYCTGSTADRTLAIGNNDYTPVAPELYSNDTIDANLRVGLKRMGASPDASVVIGPSQNTADAGAFVVRVYRNVHAITPLDTVSTTATGLNTARPDPPAITPLTAGAWIVCIGGGGCATGAVYTQAGAELEDFVSATGADTNDAIIGAGDFRSWTSGAFNPVGWTGGSNTTSDAFAAVTFALKPSPGGEAAATVSLVASGEAVVNVVAGISFNLTPINVPAGTDLLVIVCGGNFSGTNNFATATWNGVAMEPFVASFGVNGDQKAAAFMLRNPASGAQTLNLGMAANLNNSILVTALAFDNVDIAAPIGPATFATSTVTNPSTAPLGFTGGHAIGAVTYWNNDGTGAITSGGGQTRIQDSIVTDNENFAQAVDTEAVVNGAQSFSFTLAGTAFGTEIIGFTVRPSAA